ncbi:MAG: type I glyceraldehyde-3-phosphate dehydrogenase [Patescibacteria group bacterium]|jgi:glyceraldehyde 3-phosphate dehydrogenase|nr:type I glyceraldehyde-3-phosphate dehydrogenase [Patescibacteria group bacterium]
MKKKVAINGFGRIGRAAFKELVRKYGDEVEVVAINDLSEPESIVHLLKYDSVYRRYNMEVFLSGKTLVVKDEVEVKVNLYSEKDPLKLPWGELGVDVVLECTGVFRDFQGANMHIEAGAKRVVISAPSKEPEKISSFVLGVNEEKYNPEKDFVMDMGSCTTNCLSPVLKILNDNYTVLSGMMTTIHSYTMGQNLLDGSHKDLRRSRAAALNIVPTTTGAAKAVGRVIPELEGKISGMAVRVPTPTVSAVDLVVVVDKKTTKEEVNNILQEKSKQETLKSVLRIEEDPLVSTDFIGSCYSSIVDANLTDVRENVIKVFAWYDNEWGYSTRLADFSVYISRK